MPMAVIRRVDPCRSGAWSGKECGGCDPQGSDLE